MVNRLRIGRLRHCSGVRVISGKGRDEIDITFMMSNTITCPKMIYAFVANTWIYNEPESTLECDSSRLLGTLNFIASMNCIVYSIYKMYLDNSAQLEPERPRSTTIYSAYFIIGYPLLAWYPAG